MAKPMTFRQLLARMSVLAKQLADAGDEAAFDEPVTVRVHTEDDCYTGGIFQVDLDAGCTNQVGLVIDADQAPAAVRPS